jgi:polysaccharide export outer membrane protein
MNRTALSVLFCLWALQRPYCSGQVASPTPVNDSSVRSDYVLGADDMVTIQVVDVPFTDQTPMRIETSGHLRLPLVGRVMAGGLTPAQLEERIAEGLKTYVRTPQVMVRLVEFRSQPVTVVGAVTTPGIHQLRGHKTLLEIISLAGGLRQDAGTVATITRAKAYGGISLPQARLDNSGQYTVCAINLRELMEAKAPQNNILIQPTDVIAVEKAPVVYVIGAVKKSGGFVLNAQERVSVLQALAMAEGLDRVSAPDRAKVLRKSNDPESRQELVVDLKKIMNGKSADVPMQADDILFIPTSNAKNAGLRGLEAAINIGTGITIFRR